MKKNLLLYVMASMMAFSSWAMPSAAVSGSRDGDCTPVSELPFTENFEASDDLPACWSYVSNCDEWSQPQINYDYNSGSNMLDFNIYDCHNFVVMPEFDSSIDLSTLMISFSYISMSGWGEPDRMIIGVMTDPEDTATFVAVDTIENAEPYVWLEFEVPLAGYDGAGSYIVFKAESGMIAVDNINVDLIPACMKPVSVTVSDIELANATVTWTGRNGESAWDVLIVPGGTTDPDFDDFIHVDENTYTFYGLSGSTQYSVYVRADCGSDGNSVWTGPVDFRTGCPEYMVLPFMESFDGYDGDVDYPVCWWRKSNGVMGPGIKFNSSNYSSGDRSLEFLTSQLTWDMNSPDYYTWSYEYAILPPVDVSSTPINTLSLSFKIYKTYSGYGRCYIGVLSDTADLNSFTLIDSIAPSDFETNTWTDFVFNFEDFAGAGNFITVMAPSMTGDAAHYNNNQFYIDDLSITAIASCARPTNVTAAVPTSTTVEADWAPGGDETAWIVSIAPAGVSFENATTTETVYEHPYVITELEPNTAYNLYVQADCGGGDISTDPMPAAFRTLCETTSELPYIENFDNCTPGETAPMPDCWLKLNDGSSHYPCVLAGNGASGSQSMTFYTNSSDFSGIISRSLDLTGYSSGELHLAFKTQILYHGDYDGLLDVGYCTNPYDTNTYTHLQSYDINDFSAADVWYDRAIVLNVDFAVPVYFVFMAPSVYGDHWLYIDDIIIEEMSACPRPTGLTVTETGIGTVTLGWTENGGSTEWEVMYGPTGFNPANDGTIVTAATNPFTVTGLSQGGIYDFYVRAVCSNDEHSEWSDFVTSATDCEAVTYFPYIENFDHNGEMPACWTQEGVFGEAASDWSIGTGNYGEGGGLTYAHSGDRNAYFYSSSINVRSKLVSPSFDLTLVEDPHLSYWYQQEARYGSFDKLYVYYRTSPDGDWTELRHYDSDQALWNFDSVALPNPSATYQIAFEGFGQYGYGIALDDIRIFTAQPGSETCDAPTGLQAEAAAATATLTWTENGSFEVSYKKTAETEWAANTTVTGNSTTLVGLEPQTGYQWRVRRICDIDFTSEWAESSFTTEAAVTECPQPTGLTVTATTANSVTLAWQQEGDVDSWEVSCRKTGASWTSTVAATQPFTLNGLEAGTGYEARVRADCGNGAFSEYTQPITFTTSPNGIGEYAASDGMTLYPNPAASYVDVRFSGNTVAREMAVYDVYGKCMLTVAVTGAAVRIPVAELAAGVYFVKAVTGQGTVNKSFIKR